MTMRSLLLLQVTQAGTGYGFCFVESVKTSMISGLFTNNQSLFQQGKTHQDYLDKKLKRELLFVYASEKHILKTKIKRITFFSRVPCIES